MEVGRPPKLIQACCCIARSETLVMCGCVVSFGHMVWMCVEDVCFGRAVRKMMFARPRRPQADPKKTLRRPEDVPIWPHHGAKLAPRRAQGGPRRPLGSATNGVGENARRSGAIAWEVREEWVSGRYEVQKWGGKNDDFAWEVLEKLKSKRF